MPFFKTAPFATPFGRNVFLRSTSFKTESGTIAADTVPFVDIDGHQQRVLQPGPVLARITSGPDIDKLGPFQAAGSGANEVQTLTEGTAITAGTWDISDLLGVEILNIPFDVTAAALQTAIRAALAAEADDNELAAVYQDSVTVTGGPVPTAPFTITFVGPDGENVPQITVDTTNLTGTITVATSTPGAAGATDGRGDTANIVGINNTFLPWQLMEGDREVAFIYDGAVYQAQCIELDASGAEIPLTDATAAQMFGKKRLDISFHVRSTEITEN